MMAQFSATKLTLGICCSRDVTHLYLLHGARHRQFSEHAIAREERAGDSALTRGTASVDAPLPSPRKPANPAFGALAHRQSEFGLVTPARECGPPPICYQWPPHKKKNPR
jgi:hypothetical protein